MRTFLNAACFAFVVASMPLAAIGAAEEKDLKDAPPGEDPNVVKFQDIRLSIGSGPGPSKVHDEYTAGPASVQPTGTYDYQLDRKRSGIIEATYVAGKLGTGGGLVWGVGLRIAGNTLDVKSGGSYSRDLAYGRLGPVGHIDYGYAFTRNLHIEAGGLAGIGAASAEWFDRDSAGGVHAKRATGGYLEIGGRIGLYGCIARHLVLGGVFEITDTRSDVKADHADPGADELTLRSRGAGFLFTVGYRF